MAITYGNGTNSNYTYDPKTRRLESLRTMLPNGRTVQDLSYHYDLVGNVLNLGNDISTPTNTALPAGPVAQAFRYDDLYRLTNAQGAYNFGPGKQNNYKNEFVYDTIGNITKKAQEHKIIQPSMSEHLPKETNYVLNYVYGSSKPHAVTDAGDKFYTYDPAGNMTGWTHKQNGTRRIIYWNEENRVKQIDDNGKSTYFLYDDGGERVVKRGQHGESIYANRFFTIRNGELGTKSVYAGETRVVSKLVKTPPTNTANSTTTGSNVTSGTTTTIPGINGLDNGRGKKLGIIKRLPDGYQTGVNPPVEKDQFYYHGDHLGSSNMITDAYGAVYQHLEYFPYGETWIEEGGSYGGNTPGYKFTGKELDPETGLYYYGARYYDPVLSRWISTDPALGKFFNIEGEYAGIYTPKNINLYSYTINNPVRLQDPNGQDWRDVVAGIAAAGVDANTFGIAHNALYKEGLANANNQTHYGIGYTIGSIIATAQGMTEIEAGIGGEAVGFTLDATGVGALAGVPLNIASAAVIVHGGAVAITGAKNTIEALSNVMQSRQTSGSGPKAKDAPGQTASGQATDKYGNKLGPSGKSQINKVEHSTQKAAKDAARQEGKQAPVKHASPKKGDSHYHPTDKSGEKIPGSTHHEY